MALSSFRNSGLYNPSPAYELTVANITATTGTVGVTTSGLFTIYTWTTSGSLTLNSNGLATVLCVAGGGGGGNAGGGGGGVLVIDKGQMLVGTAQVVVGAGGSGPTNGNDSLISPHVALGGGNGNMAFGGSGGGKYAGDTSTSTGVLGQGHGGAYDLGGAAGGAGGAGGPGLLGVGAPSHIGGNGGPGRDVSATFGAIGGASGIFGGGASGSAYTTSGLGGSGGGGRSSYDGGRPVNAIPGTALTGGGGGGDPVFGQRSAGGSGIVALRVRTN